jgi:AbrB family looped-hinge helix DNA binding protein
MAPEAGRMQAEISGLTRVSDKIRALDRAGYSRSDIARFLGKRYQHVRNVLVGDKLVAQAAAHSADDQSVQIASQFTGSRSEKVRIGQQGQVSIPASFRDSLGLKVGDVLFARVENGEIHLLTPKAAMRRAQAIVRQFVPEGVSLVDELLEDRRREAHREQQGG